jgi:hypothetical protein
MSTDMGYASLHGGWMRFRLLLPPDAPAVQLIEMRRAFYAGAAHMYAGLLEGTDLPENETLDRLKHYQDELRQFPVDIAEGRA